MTIRFSLMLPPQEENYFIFLLLDYYLTSYVLNLG